MLLLLLASGSMLLLLLAPGSMLLLLLTSAGGTLLLLSASRAMFLLLKLSVATGTIMLLLLLCCWFTAVLAAESGELLLLLLVLLLPECIVRICWARWSLLPDEYEQWSQEKTRWLHLCFTHCFFLTNVSHFPQKISLCLSPWDLRRKIKSY